jgi:isopenicillin N synthase-like dioxygenase
MYSYRAFNFGEFKNGKAAQPLPKPLQQHEDFIGRFIDQCHALCNRVLELFGKALEIPETEGGRYWFTQRHDRNAGPSGSVFRLLYVSAVVQSY